MIRQVALEDLRVLLLELFQEWGLPKAIRTDNGSPLGSPTRTVIPVVSLWLAAWGIKHILNRPKMPTDNSHVENNQHTSARWAEVYKCSDHIEMEQKLDEVCTYQRDFFKVSRLGKVTRKQLYPKLYQKPRKFQCHLFEEQKAYQLLAQAIYPRKVSANGVIRIYEKPFSVGAKHRGAIVFVSFSAKDLAWVCTDQTKQILKVFPDPRFSRENLYNLTIGQ